MMRLPNQLIGRRVQLIELELQHTEALFQVAQSPEIWRYMPHRIETKEQMESWIKLALEGKQAGSDFAYAVYDTEEEKLVGSTRFLNISLPNKQLEIGWTWYTPDVWRTGINRECKYLLMKHCFEELGIIRVQYKADARNVRSNTAIKRLGAVREGLLRKERILSDGHIRDAYIYSILDSEWPKVKQSLEATLYT